MMTINKIFLILALGIIATLSYAQEPISLHDFSGGMNTEGNQWSVKANECYRLENFFIRDKALYVRPGYSSVMTYAVNYDQIFALHSYKFANGKGFLFAVARRYNSVPQTDSGYCHLTVSDAYSYNADSALASYLYPIKGKFVIWLNNIYYFSDRDRSICIRGGPDQYEFDYLIPGASGELIPHAINTAGNLKGNYVYGFLTRKPYVSYQWLERCSYLSKPILTDSEKVVIEGFPPLIAISNETSPIDTIDYILVRSKADRFLATDSLWMIDTLNNIGNDTTFDVLYTDTLGDAGLTGRFWKTFEDAYEEFGDYSYGSPEQIAVDEIDNAADTFSTGPALDSGYTAYYMLTFFEPDLEAESDSSLTHSVVNFINNHYKSITVSLPIAPSGYDRILYKAVVPYGEFGQNFYPLDTITSAADTSYFDSLSITYLALNRVVHSREVIDNNFHGAIIHEGRMYAWDDHYIYVSQSGLASKWAFFDKFDFDMDDGQRIINLVSSDGFISVYKTNSIYTLWTEDGAITHRTKKASGIGMVAANSLVSYNGYSLFLGPLGLYLEEGNIYKDNSIIRMTLTDEIEDLIRRGLDSMSTAVGAIYNDMYFLSYPGTDTTFWLDLTDIKNPGMGTMSFDMDVTVYYDTLNRTAFSGYNTLLFTQDDDNRLFSFGSPDTTDEGADFVATFEKKYLGVSTARQTIPNEIYLWTNSDVANTDTIGFTVTTEKFDTIATFNIDSLDNILNKQAFELLFPQSFHYFNLTITAPNRKNLQIDGVEILPAVSGID